MSNKAKTDFQNLTWFDLQSWAGSRVVSKGKSYQQSNLVEDLTITESDDLVAWVTGSTTYATKVFFHKGSLASVCTCPYYGPCKHAVALILAYLDCIQNDKEVPTASSNDERLLLLEKDPKDVDDDDDDRYNDAGKEVTTERKNRTLQFSVDDYLGNKSKEELLDIIRCIISRNPEIWEDLNYKAQITRQKPLSLIKIVEREILKASSNPGWRDHWKHTGFTPDYSRVRSGLQELLDEGHADEVVRLGKKLFSKGTKQVEQSHDEGDTAYEVADTLKIVFKALGECSISSVEKMEMAVEFKLSDEYDLCSGLEIFWNRSFGKENWNEFADRLLRRLGDFKSKCPENVFIRDYRRDTLSNEIIRALENAGREEEVIEFCMEEAKMTGSYIRLVKKLRNVGRIDEAETWIRKGIATVTDKLPGIASSLKEELLEIKRVNKDWAYIAALQADDFIEHPGIKAFEELKKSSEKAQVWPQVREAILHFLETGERPGENRLIWPLPDTGIRTYSSSKAEKWQYTPVLIDIAIYEERIEDVLKWFEIYKKKGNDWGDHIKDNVAAAIAQEYPERAVALWKELAEKNISVTNVSSYSVGAQYLRKAQNIIKQSGKTAEWHTYLQGLKDANRRRPRCIEILNALSESPIIQHKS
ncbi:MAG TPA: hypothetical protein DCP92_11160 [Nitrospiraceae bacterium]|nr:hypothetical protein [Nitrospiraceae bacterium]